MEGNLVTADKTNTC